MYSPKHISDHELHKTWSQDAREILRLVRCKHGSEGGEASYLKVLGVIGEEADCAIQAKALRDQRPEETRP